MENKKNSHIKAGLIFIAVTITIGVLLYFLVVSGSQKAATEGEELTGAIDSLTDECAQDEITIPLPQDIASGTIEFLTPIMDTDAKNQQVYDVRQPMCISKFQMQQFAKDAGLDNSNLQQLDFEVSWDPLGQTSKYRSRFLYDSEAFNMAEVEPAPLDMRFGNARWDLSSNTIPVTWINDFRQFQMDNFTNENEDGNSDDEPEVGSEPSDLEERYTNIYYECINTGDAAEGVTSAMLSCIGNEIDRQDADLNETYKKRMTSLTPKSASKLRTLQRAWIKDRDRTCELESEPESGGTLASIIYSSCILDQTIERTIWLERYRP